MTLWELATIEKPHLGPSVFQIMTPGGGTVIAIRTESAREVIHQLLKEGWEPIGANFAVGSGNDDPGIEFYALKKAHDPSNVLNDEWLKKLDEEYGPKKKSK